MTVAKVAAANAAILSEHMLLLLRCGMLGVNLLAIVDKLRRTETKEVMHQRESSLPRRITITIHGGMWATFFTVQSWLLQSFFLVGACTCSASSLGLTAIALPDWLPAMLWVAYEVSFAVAILISFLVKYVIIPEASRKGVCVDNFFTMCDLLMHNANVSAVRIELAGADDSCAGGVPCRWRMVHYECCCLVQTVPCGVMQAL
jgi:hypothetical protein